VYILIIIALMGVLPIASILIEYITQHGTPNLLFLVGKWFVFWAVGVRLLLAGLRQTANPAFTAETVFGVKGGTARAIVQELGFGNLAIGLLGALTIIKTAWVVPAAITGGLFYGLAALKHALEGDRNRTRTIAMMSDLFIFAALAGFLVAGLSS
jgi:hypothetical protein